MIRQVAISSLLSVFLTIGTAYAETPISLNYDAEAYGYTITTAPAWSSDTDQVFSNNGTALAMPEASAGRVWICPEGIAGESSKSNMIVSFVGNYYLYDANLVSHLEGYGSWYFEDCDSSTSSGTGSGEGNGHTSSTGTIDIGVLEGYPAGSSAMRLELTAEIITGTWDSQNWWLKIWDTDPDNPLVLLNDSNLSTVLDVLAGTSLNFEFYHGASENYWPESGLSSDLTIELDLILLTIADFDNDNKINLTDLSILGSQWQDVPGTPSADIAPVGGDGIVDACDLDILCDQWLEGTELPLKVTGTFPANDVNDLSIYTDLSWSSDMYATSYDVYFGTDFNDVNDAGDPCSLPGRGNQTETTYDPGVLDHNSVYYWRIDAKNINGTTKGDIWHFGTGGLIDPNLVSWWMFDDGSGSNANDSVGSNDGTVSGAAWTTGQIGGALSFDGGNDYVQVSDDPSLDFADEFTLSVWVKPAYDTLVGRLVYRYDASSQDGYFLSQYSDGKWYLVVFVNGSSVNVSSDINSSADTWAHVAGIRDDSGNLKLYVNGQAQTASATLSGAIDSSGDLFIGVDLALGNDFAGIMDDVRVYDKALSAGEVLSLYQAGAD